MKADLHIHSYYSDGLSSPQEVLQMAATAGCQTVALTDHDTLDGIDEANAAAKSLGIRNIAGVEISAYAGCKVHILGYGVDKTNKEFCDFIAAQKLKRRERAEKFLVKLAEYGMPVPPEELVGCVEREISRPHIAMAMVRLGYERDWWTAMHKWLFRGAPTYVPMQGIAPEVAIEEIHAAGGYAVLAHPVRLNLDSYARTDLIRRLAAAGLDGLEAKYKRSSRAAVRTFSDLARECGMFVTAGADYHGENNEIIPRDLSKELLDKLERGKRS